MDCSTIHRRTLCALGAAAAGCCLALAFPAWADDAKGLEPEIERVMHLQGAAVAKLDLPNQLGEAMRVSVPLGGGVMTLDVTPFSVRDEGYVLWEQVEGGNWRQADPGPESTFRGELVGMQGSMVAGGMV